MNYNLPILTFMLGLCIALFLLGNKKMKEVIDHTLKNPKTGMWSRKNLAGFFAFAFTIFYCGYGMVNEKQVQEFVVLSFLGFAATCLGLSSWEKSHIPKSDIASDPTTSP